MPKTNISDTAMFKARIVLVACAAVFPGAAPLHAQGTASPAEPNAVFIPQAQPGQAKATKPARKAAPKAATQNQAQTGVAPPGATVGALPNQASEGVAKFVRRVENGPRRLARGSVLILA